MAKWLATQRNAPETLETLFVPTYHCSLLEAPHRISNFRRTTSRQCLAYEADEPSGEVTVTFDLARTKHQHGHRLGRSAST